MTEKQMEPVLPSWHYNPAAEISHGRNSVRGGLALRITATEFTWYVPTADAARRTFAVLVIEYEPDQRCINQDAFGEYVRGFQDQALEVEAVAVQIGNELVKRVMPKWMTVEVQMVPREGTTFWPRFEYSAERDGYINPDA